MIDISNQMRLAAHFEDLHFSLQLVHLKLEFGVVRLQLRDLALLLRDEHAQFAHAVVVLNTHLH